MVLTYMGLTLDKCICISRFSPAGHVLDAQDCIAHNDTTIAFAYGHATSFKYWLPNFSTTLSE